jgi:hypothetical protein
MCRNCRIHGSKNENIKIWLENLKTRNNLGDLIRWKDYIKIVLRETGHESVNWTELVQNRVQW